MPIDSALCTKTWYRYSWVRDNGHSKYVEKADKCDRFFLGDQWDPADKQKLTLVKRPALTVNKSLPTVANVMGEQILNRAEISFRPRNQGDENTAETLAKLYKQISDANQLDWKRSDMFADGIIMSRGYLDVRLSFTQSMQGEVCITGVNSKNVMVDPDAEDYDPDTWNDVIITKWLTADDIAVLYNPEDAEILRNHEQSFFPFGYDSIYAFRDRFGDRTNPIYQGTYDESQVIRSMRVIERQHRILATQKHFVDVQTGDMRPIPDEFDRNRISMICDQFKMQVTTKLINRIRWTTICDNVRLHDDWGPYKHFTLVPYFPHFRRGKTLGLVENLLDPQELLNKVRSQELHIVNTTANSGWKVKRGTLANLTVEELEEKGAMTGLVVEVNGDPEKDLVKIQPNQVPQGLDRIGFKAEDSIKTISGVSDSAQGFDREDVAAKAIQEKRKAGSTNLVKPLDSLIRTDFILARNILDLVQEFYTEQRVLTITADRTTGGTEEFTINQITETGEILNDLTLGEYDVVISSVPQRETLEDSQFDQALALKKEGVGITDKVLIQSSRLMHKKEILADMEAAANSPQAQQQAQLQIEGLQAEIDKLRAEAASKNAEAPLKQAKAQKELAEAQKSEQAGPDPEIALKVRDQEFKESMQEREFELKQKEVADKQLLDEQKARAEAARKAVQPKATK